jgi:hypothetical protein
MTVFTVFSLWAEPRHVRLAQDCSNVLIPALLAVLAKAARVPCAFPNLRIWIDMEILALWVGTFSQFGVEPAFGHLFKVILMQKLAELSLFA